MKKRTSDSPGPSNTEFAFGPFQLQQDGTLLRENNVVHLPPKELAALQLLIEHAGQIVSSEQLRKALWGEVHVTADSVPRCLSSLRARLEPENCIQTIYKRGYRFSAALNLESPPSALPRLAILPFTPGPNVQPHLGSAISEETITRLTPIQPAFVSVLARDSVFTLAARGLTAHRVGQMLKADLVLTGTLSALPSQFRLRAEMIRVDDGSQIWVEDLLISRDRDAGLEVELAERLFFRLQAGVHIDAWTGSPHGSESDLSLAADGAAQVTVSERREAYALFQSAHFEWQALERHRMQDALQRLLRATELDPFLMEAKVDLAQLCVAQAVYGFVSPSLAADCVHQAALSIPDFPNRAEAILPPLGLINLLVDRDLPAALFAFSGSAHLPHDAWTTFARTNFALSRHRFDEAIEILQAAIKLDPYAPWLHSRLAWALHLAGRNQQSMDRLRFCMKTFPGHDSAAVYGSMILPFSGDAEGGLRLAETLSAHSPHFDFVIALHAYALACAGHETEARERVERLQWLGRERYVSPSFNASIFVALGDHPAALAELRAAEQTRCPWFFQMLADPRLEPLHQYPQFQDMRAILATMEAAAALRPPL